MTSQSNNQFYSKQSNEVELDSMTINKTEIIFVISLINCILTVKYYVDTFLKGKLPPIDKLGGRLHVSIDLNVLVSLGFADM